jgi:hypothetical protein
MVVKEEAAVFGNRCMRKLMKHVSNLTVTFKSIPYQPVDATVCFDNDK